MRAVAIMTVVGAVLASACSDERVYIGDGKLYQVALTDMTEAAVEGEMGALYIVETRVELPILRPTDADLQDLARGAADYQGLPFPRLPWVERGDVELTVDFTLSNLDGEDHEVDVTINAANEFDEYFPGVIEIDDTPVPLHAQWERTYSVPGKSRITRTVREEELDEAAVDLATVVNGAPNSDEIVYFENKSKSDERSIKYIPAVVPGLIALRLGLRTTDPGSLLLEATVRARDAGDKLAEGDDPRLQVTPEAFMAVVPEN